MKWSQRNQLVPIGAMCLVQCTVAAMGLLWVGPAEAFHTGKTFTDPPGAGGAGGLYYVGSPRERGWTCAACHHDTTGRLQVRFFTPLFEDFTYTPGETYPITVRIVKELVGESAGRSNFNGMALNALDSEQAPAGSFSDAPAERYEIRSSSRGDLAIASAGRTTGETEWTFSWTAPEAGTGNVTFYLGVVDGNGANSAPDETLTDPFGDEVYVANVQLRER